MEIFKAYTRGYMEKAKAFLTPTEIKLLPYGGLMELSQAELHIMEIRDGLAQRTLGYIGQHGLEITERFEEIEKRAEAMCIQERLYREGQLKKRTNHCDTKVNNMMVSPSVPSGISDNMVWKSPNALPAS